MAKESRTESEEVKTRDGDTTTKKTVQKTFALLVTKEGKTYLNGAEVDDNGLVAAVNDARSKGEDVQAIVGADKNATHGTLRPERDSQ